MSWPGRSKPAVDASLPQEGFHRVEILPAQPGEAARLVEAEVRDRELVRMVDRLADDARVAAAAPVAHELLLENDDLPAGARAP